MVINRLSDLVLGFGVGFTLVHTTLVVVLGCVGMFQGWRLTIVNVNVLTMLATHR